MSRLLLILFAAWICCIWCEQNHTRNPDFVERVLSRKRRFLLFPPGSAMVCTMSFTKSLVPRSPSGINLIAEVDIFYPLQTQITDYFPTKKPPSPSPSPAEEEEEEEAEEEGEAPAATPTRPAASAAPTRPKQPTAILQDGEDNYDPQNHPGEVYVTAAPKRVDVGHPLADIKYPGPALDYSPRQPYFWQPTPAHVYPTTPVRFSGSPFVAKQRLFNEFNDNNYLNEADLMLNTHHSQVLRPPNTVLYPRNRPQARNSHEVRGRPWAPMDAAGDYYYRHGRSAHNEDSSQGSRQKADSAATMTMAHNEDDIENHQSWQHYHSYKERRDLFAQLQAITSFDGFDVRTCIYRMICEARHFLLPPGISLFQDIFRILFVLPLKPDLNDGYSEAMRKNATECSTHFGIECRYSILGYMLHNQLRVEQ